MDTKQRALELVVAELERDQGSEFSRAAFLEVLRRLPAVPRVPGEPVFVELMRKAVPLSVELVLFKDAMASEVLLTYRKDQFFVGWHFPGTYRTPNTPSLKTSFLEDVQRCADNEIGGVTITGVRQIGFAEHPDSRRFHDACMVVVCDFEGEVGEREGVRWFSTRIRPPDFIEEHHSYWEMIVRERDARLVRP